MDLGRYLKIAWRWWWLVALSVALSAMASYFYSQNLPKVYAARTTLMVGSNIIENPNPNLQEMGSINTLASVYGELAKRKLVTQAVIDKLGLQMSSEQLAEMIQTSVIAKAQLLEIFVLDINPQRAQMIANAVAEELIFQSPTGSGKQQERDQFIQAQLADLQVKIENTNNKIKELEDTLGGLTSAVEIAEAQSKLAELEKLKGDYQDSYNKFLGNISNEAINRLAVFEPAAEPTTPVSPDIKMNVLLAAVAGMVLAVSAIVLLEFFNDILVWQPDETHAVLGLPILGAIGKINGSNKIVAQGELWSPQADALRNLRSSIFLAAGEKKLTSLLVTSTLPSEGKSFVSANLAAIVASPGSSLAAVLTSSGSRVILVDADLRKPTQHEIFEMPNLLGLAEVLSLPEAAIPSMLDKVLRPTGINNLLLLPAGRSPLDPGYLLNSPRFAHLLELLATKADLVIIDSAPLLAAAETRFIANVVDGTLLVITDGRTGRRVVQKAVNYFRDKQQNNLLGLVFNRVRSAGQYAYYSTYRSHVHELQEAAATQSKRQNGWLGKLWPRRQPAETISSTLSLSEAANYLGVSKQMAQRWCEEGRLPATKIRRNWLVNLGDLDEFIAGYQPESNITEPDTVKKTVNGNGVRPLK